MQKRQARVDVACALAGLLDQRGDVVAGHIEQTLEALRLFVGVHVDALRVLDQLPLKRLGIVDVDDAGGKGEELRKLCGAEASCSRNDLEAFRVGPYGDGLDESVGADALGKLLQLASSKVRRGLVADSWMVSMAMYWNSLLFCTVVLLCAWVL